MADRWRLLMPVGFPLIRIGRAQNGRLIRQAIIFVGRSYVRRQNDGMAVEQFHLTIQYHLQIWGCLIRQCSETL